MATLVQRRRGTTEEHALFTGKVGELTIDTDKKVLVTHDGEKAGGYPHALMADLVGHNTAPTSHEGLIRFRPWAEDGNYAPPYFVVGSNGYLYACKEPSGPDTNAGPKDPILPDSKVYWGAPQVSAPDAGASSQDVVNKGYVDGATSVALSAAKGYADGVGTAAEGYADSAVATAKSDILNYFIYSYNEQDTGEKWIDGKPVYRKVINCGALPDAASKAIPHNIQNIGDVIEFYGISVRTTGLFLPLPFAISFPPGTTTDNIAIQIGSENITIMTGKGGMSTLYTKTWAIVRYTKAA
jgi:hypothetical protein